MAVAASTRRSRKAPSFSDSNPPVRRGDRIQFISQASNLEVALRRVQAGPVLLSMSQDKLSFRVASRKRPTKLPPKSQPYHTETAPVGRPFRSTPGSTYELVVRPQSCPHPSYCTTVLTITTPKQRKYYSLSAQDLGEFLERLRPEYGPADLSADVDRELL